ncbi:chromate transporter [Treponema endosymbiont of Eucomonympha sp.]|uniref:chromate transporter n=1 Tax=Treponema endosymbiont of Eucomonympha sp. TaxID=1580831 RepID=UPI000751A4F1|nr:chromate transporter [Treponema endosymbiont of Eucomonympha sp.]
MSLPALYAEFFKIGLFSIGGGLATLPFLYKLADKYDWLTGEMVGNMLALAQSAPGAIGVNISALAGFQCAGIAGAFAAALGLVSPSVVIIVLVARAFRAFKENALVQAAFSGLRPAAAGLLAAAAFGAIRLSVYDSAAPSWRECLKLRECALFALVFALLRACKWHPAAYVALAGAAGILLGL